MTSVQSIAIIFFFYGLAFFSMGLAITLEISKCSDPRMRTALRPLAAFGFLHGAHEWLEMFDLLGALHLDTPGAHMFWEIIRLLLLVWSFLSLGVFGAFLLVHDVSKQRLSLMLPLILVGVWGFGLFFMRSVYPYPQILDVADVWARYVLAIPSSLFACAGLVVQQREFRKAGMAEFGRDALWAAVAFFWYGMIGQTFTRATPLFPSNFVNMALFIELFGFPVQLLRAGAAIFASIFVIRFLRAFEVETQRQIDELRSAQLEEAHRREALRGEILRRIVDAQEAERQRIARELHDETGQALTAIGLGLRGVSTTLRADVDKAAKNLRQLEGLVKHSLIELQRLIADLRPSHLDDLGLAATLRWYTTELQSRADLAVHLEIDGVKRSLPLEMKTALFRIIQEALTNVIKHADADQISIKVIYKDREVVARVEDDGSGFDLHMLGNSSYGLLGMRERASLLGGSLSIDSRPGRGTAVEVAIPYLMGLELEIDEHSDSSGG